MRIQNFKSIRDLSFEAKRINVFIGEPNTGKSNILEALAFFDSKVFSHFKEIFRFKTVADLFFDQKVASEMLVQAGEWRLSLTFKQTNFRGMLFQGETRRAEFTMSHEGPRSWGGVTSDIRYYRFKPNTTFSSDEPGLLNPPFGDNLVAVLYSNEELRQTIGSLFRSKGLRLQLKPIEHELLITKDVRDELYSYPWESVSETLRRIVFFMAVLETNRKASLLLDEPEANTFPFYTKYLAERIALDETNQFFITTHNPVLLGSILSKAPANNINVFVTHMEDFTTKIRLITGERLSEILDLSSDVFFNLDKLLAA